MRYLLSLIFTISFILCSNAQCTIAGLVVEPHPCDQDNQFLLDVDFEYAGVSDSFEIGGNGMNHGHFAYVNLPITLGPLSGDCNTEYEFIINDLEFEECSADIELGTICCEESPCEIGGIEYEVACDGEIAFITVNFEYTGVGEEFELRGNGQSYGIFMYSDLPVTFSIDPDCDLNYELVVIDQSNDECVADIELGAICCEEEECMIDITGITMTDCSDEGASFTVNIDYTETDDLGFDVWIDSEFHAFYNYDQIPFTVENYISDASTIIMTICDNDNEACCDELLFDNPCSDVVSNIPELLSEIQFIQTMEEYSIINNNTFSVELKLVSIEGSIVDEYEVQAGQLLIKDKLSLRSGMYILILEHQNTRKVFKLIAQ